MKRSGWVIAGVVALVAILAVPVAFAQHMKRGGHEGMGGFGMFGRIHHLAEQLDLSETQKSQLHEIAMGVRDQNREYRQTMHANILAAGKVLIANPNDIAGAQAILAKNADAESAMKANILKGVSQGLGVLTPDQRTKLASILEEHMSRMEK